MVQGGRRRFRGGPGGPKKACVLKILEHFPYNKPILADFGARGGGAGAARPYLNHWTGPGVQLNYSFFSRS